MNNLFCLTSNNIFAKYLTKLFTIIPRTLTRIVEQQNVLKIRYLYYAYLCLNFSRCNIFSILLNNQKYLKVYLNYDVMFNILMQLNLLDQVSTVFASLLPLYLIYMDNIIYGKQKKSALLLWKYAFDVIVKSKFNFLKLNFVLTGAYTKFMEILKTKKAVLHYQNFFLNTFSSQTRVEIILVSYFYDFIIGVGLQIEGTFFVCLYS